MNLAPAGYIKAVLGPREAVLDEILRSSLLEYHMPTIQVDDNAGRVLQVLMLLRAPQRAIEIGTLFGYSTIYLARGLPPGGRLTSLEIDPAAADLARVNIAKVGLADRVEVLTCDATTYLQTVEPESVGFVFIDGDKKSYVEYLKLCFPALEKGGLLVADDAFAMGDFSIEHDPRDEVGQEEAAIRSYAVSTGRSPRLHSAFVGTETGLMVSYKW